MSQRLTRASAARLNADPSAQASPSTTTDTGPPPAPPPSTRKRKAEVPTPTSRETRRTKKPRGGNDESAGVTETPASGRKKNKRASAAAMSNAGYARPGQGVEDPADQDRPSPSTSGETSPQQAPRDSSRRKSNRRKSKEEQSGSASGSASRKSKKSVKKEQDAQMKDDDEKVPQQEQSAPKPDEQEPPPDTGGGADGDDDPMRRFTEEEMDAMERNGDDPFMSGYFSRFGGGAGGLSSSLRALSGIMSGTHGRLRNILDQLRTKDDPSVQMVALSELSELLLVSNEDNLAGHFSPEQYIKELVPLMQPHEITGEENSEMMLLACRCIANMMEALPAATASVVYGGAVPVLCQKLLEIHFIDLAEQALSTLEKISVEFPSSIVREGGLTACLTYLDFFATSTQRTAVTTAANCCRNIPEDSFATVRDVMPILLSTLSSSDQRVVEQASLCVSRIVDSFKYHDSKLEELVSPELLKAILRLLLPGSTNLIGPNIHTSFLRVLSTTSRASPRLSVELMKMGVVDTLYQILTGVSSPSDTDAAASKIDKNIIMQAIIRTPRDQIFETLNVICELLPAVSREGLTFLDDLHDAGYGGIEHVSLSTRSKKSPNDERVELLSGCPAEVKRFTLILFPTLMHAYTSTVNLNVRQKVLTAQLKMLSNFETDILEISLRGVTYASHLASILTQQDNSSLVTYALQAAELLLKRMGNIYRPQFYREGVMAEITKLAERPVKELPKEVEATDVQEDTAPAARIEVLEQQDEPMDVDEQPETIDVDVQPQLDEAAEAEHEDEDLADDNEDDEDEIDHEPDMRMPHEGIIDDDGDESDDSEEPPSQRPPVLDMQDIITHRAKRFMEAHRDSGSQEMSERATRVLQDLSSLATELKTCYSGIKSQGGAALFRRLAKHFDGDALESITSYELMNSGIVEVLLEIFNDDDKQAATEARADFLEVFMSTQNASNLATGDVKSPSTAFSVLIYKLQDVLSRSEHFEVVTVNHNAFENNRGSAASMLAKTLRLRLVADADSGIPEPFRNVMVSIHAIATFSSLDSYLRPRVNPDRPERPRKREGITSAMAAYAAAVAGRGDRSAPPPPVPRLPGMDSTLPSRDGPKKLPRTKSSKSEETAQIETPRSEEPGSGLRRSSRRRSAIAPADVSEQPKDVPAAVEEPSAAQEALECPDEERFSDDGDDDDIEADIDAIADELEEEDALNRRPSEPTAVNIEAGGSGKVTARTEDGARVGTPSGTTPVATPTTRDRMSASARLMAARELLSTPSGMGGPSRPMSYASALQQVPQDWHLEFSVHDQPMPNETTVYRACHLNHNRGDHPVSRSIWSATHTIKFKRVPGPPPADRASSALTPEQVDENGLPLSLSKHPVTSGILRLMGILHDLNNNLDDVLAEHKSSVRLTAEPLSQFVNTKLTAKLNRQLEEPLIVASQCLPGWAEDLARLYSFLFPFETRHLFLQSTSYGYSRSMARWQGQNDTDNHRRHHRDERPYLGRTQRQKVRISRSRILESAMKVMELYGQSSSVLEVEYFEEVGTGLGPTLEFYSSVSKEFSKKKTKMWRENESSEAGDYAFGRRGLFPAPMSEEMSKGSNGEKVLHLFKMLGKFIARSMLDSRIIDVSLNPTFFRIGDGQSAVTPSLGAVAAVDQDLARSLKMLKKYAAAKQRIDEDQRLSPAKKAVKIHEIRINDARIEDLGLDFTLPGHPHIELVDGGSRKNVTIDDVGDYIKRVIELTLGSGVQRQVDAFREGFSQVFPYSALRAFTPDELVMLFGRNEEDWSLETLMDAIKADHGYNLDSKSVRNLLQTMSELPPQSKRDFLQFITGSPKLPIGGFKSLTPMFTVVCKPSEPPFGPDDYLPSVMTCVNYLKMPDYSTLDVLKNKLGVAIKEGQGAFHLS